MITKLIFWSGVVLLILSGVGLIFHVLVAVLLFVGAIGMALVVWAGNRSRQAYCRYMEEEDR